MAQYNCGHGICILKVFLYFLQVPIVANALGGILVGLVTTYAGGVRKVSLLRKKNTYLYYCFSNYYFYDFFWIIG